MSAEYLFNVSDADADERVDRFVSAAMAKESKRELSRTYIQQLTEQGLVLVNGKVVAKNRRLAAGENVSVTLPPAAVLRAEAQNIPLEIVFEDDDVIVVNKPKGMVVHPAPGNADGTLVNALLWHCGSSLSGINGVLRPGIVHRIDKDTSGLLIVAKNDFAHRSLAQQLAEHTFTRQYEAVVRGLLSSGGVIDEPIGRSEKDRKKFCVTGKNSKEAVTNYDVIAPLWGFTHITCRLQTGRTHQIRVHMAYIGHPLAGDQVYGPRGCEPQLHGQCLHARTLGFVHPRSGERLEFTSPLPDYFTKFIKTISE